VPAAGGLHNGAVAVTYVPDPPLAPNLVGQWQNRIPEINTALGVRADIVLNGDKILDVGGTRALDGNALATVGQDGYTTYVDLRLPSGDGVQGGDFESWVFLSAPPVPAQVAGIEPATDAVLTAPPTAVHVMFSKDVVRRSVTASNVVVTGPSGAAIPGAIDPFPFDPQATLISGITFTPSSATAFATPGVYQVKVLGTGASPIKDTDGMALDGLASGGAGDYTSRFLVVQPPQPPEQ
jgi:hypothetical protein